MSTDTSFKTNYLTVSHEGQFPAVTISFNLASGVALSDVLSAINNAAKTNATCGPTIPAVNLAPHTLPGGRAMYTGPFALLLGILLAISLLGGFFALAAGACESVGCVIGTALVDTALHVILVCLLFEPIRKYVIKLNQDAERRNLVRTLEGEVGMARVLPERPHIVNAMWLASLNPTIMRLSSPEVDAWTALTETAWHGDRENAARALDFFIDRVRQNLPRRQWPGWFPFQPT